jgi:HAD superfamily hydrolase (TIGR01459 family)
MQSLSRAYPVWFVDIWGVVHNGVAPFAQTTDVLARHRANSGTVVLVSNSPRSQAGVIAQLHQVGVRADAYDTAVTSGDATQNLMREVPSGKLYHIGAERDVSLFEGLAVQRVGMAEADAVICTGLRHDDRETVGDYTDELGMLAQRQLTMICANPDKRVRKGSSLIYCAGALADAYEAMGGTVLMAGKPYAPIYDLALRKASTLRGLPVSKDMVLAIGDGPETDVLGAANQGFPVVYVAGGVREQTDDLAAEQAHIHALVPNARILMAVDQLQWEA